MSSSMVHITPALEGCFTSSTNQTFFSTLSFYFLSSKNTTPHHPQPCQLLLLFSQFFDIIAIFPFLTILTHMPFFCNGIIPHQIFYFILIFLFSCIILLFHFYFWDIFYLQVCGHTYHTSGTTAKVVYYRLLRSFFFRLFPLFCF